MKKIIFLVLPFILSSAAWAQVPDSVYARQNYDKFEYMIPMRDGVKLFTAVYVPKDKSVTYPFLLNRTCYSVAPYGVTKFPRGRLGQNKFLMHDKYIFVSQDVRGRWMSEGTFDNMRPNIPGNNVKDKTAVDESSDTFDTIEWLLKNIKGNNGRVGMYGISYPGFYTAAAIPDAHPALKASSPQAPISDFFYDDFHHQGVYLQSYTAAFAVFGYQHPAPTSQSWYDDKIKRFMELQAKDGYEFNLSQGPLKNITEKFHYDNFFWQQIIDHPNYDEFWQKRSLLPHLTGVKHAVMTVGGWFDAEDLYGPLNIYKKIESSSPSTYNTIVMGPWGHGDWASERGASMHNHIYFGDSISTFYQREIERTFFNSILKDNKQTGLPEAYMFDCGLKVWKKFDTWPPKGIAPVKLYFGEGGKLSINAPTKAEAVFDYISDPAHPVPYTSQTEGLVFTPRRFMSDDQREASTRPDVITFQTEPLTEDITLAGEIAAKLKVSMSGTDADFIVKLIDVYPPDTPNDKRNPPNIIMAGYQQLVRSEVFRGRFRNSMEKPEPFEPGKVTDVSYALQDVLHTFKKGHRVMIQIHSTWFPYIDRNPQKYVDNIYKANAEDFIKSEIKVYGSSVVEIGGGERLNTKIDAVKK
ncbi:MAG TPA: CocE/NonD family hydrolase [Cyclobacteriaceae bacterium]|nr:CocE/NonD family hydrolase [Cyclobacteriaceae bacterium]